MKVVRVRFDQKDALIGHILAAEGIAADDAVMVGDRRHDIEGARANRVRAARGAAAWARVRWTRKPDTWKGYTALQREKKAKRKAAEEAKG